MRASLAKNGVDFDKLKEPTPLAVSPRARVETAKSFPGVPTSSWPAKAGHPRLCCQPIEKTWMPTRVGMTMWKRTLRHVERLFPGES
jgi:hypothetical protein